MSEATANRAMAAVVTGGPFVLLGALVSHPFIINKTDKQAVAQALTAGTGRWAAAHIGVGIGFGVLLLALLAVRNYLGNSGEGRSAAAVPFLVMGTVMFTFLPAMETAMAGAVRAGMDPIAFYTELNTWLLPITVGASLAFSVGAIILARSVFRSQVLGPRITRVAAIALVIMAVVRFAPSSAAHYVSTVAAIVALVPFGLHMWADATAAESRRAAPAAR